MAGNLYSSEGYLPRHMHRHNYAKSTGSVRKSFKNKSETKIKDENGHCITPPSGKWAVSEDRSSGNFKVLGFRF